MPLYDFQDDTSEDLPFDVAASQSVPSRSAVARRTMENTDLPIISPPVRLAPSTRSVYGSHDENNTERVLYPVHSLMEYSRIGRGNNASLVITPSLYGQAPFPRSTPQHIYQESPYHRSSVSSPPRTRYSQQPPGTPNTISLSQDEEDFGETYLPSFFRHEGQRESFSPTWETVTPNVFKQEGHGENSSSIATTVRHENSARLQAQKISKSPKKQVRKEKKEQASLATKSAMIAMLLIILLGILMLVGAYFIFNENDKNAETVPSDPNVFNWPTSRPTNSGTSNQLPTVDLERLPTPSPSSSSTFTSKPTTGFQSIISDFLFEKDDLGRVSISDPAMEQALEWLVDEATEAQSILFPFGRMQKYRQRFAVLTLYFSLDRNTPAESALPNLEMRNQDECSWTGITCDVNGMVADIKLPQRDLDGTLPAEWGFLSSLTSIDLSKNKIQGSIPEGLYDILGLEEVHLYKNQLTGTISSKIGNLWDLRRFHLNQNQLSGSIPPEVASTASRVRKLRYFNVHRNQMTGSIPSNMRLRQLYSIDLGRNRFSGTLPPDFGTESVRLRHLYLDHNELEGTFPWEVLNAGDGRLKSLALENNQFSGTFPGNHLSNYTLVELTIQSNNFVSMERDTCDLDVFSGGNLVEFKSNCLVCRCGVALMCKHCIL